jgi:4-alpha-glucanotransferase
MPAPQRPAPARRIVGCTVPLFSLRTANSWGIGEIGDLPAFAGLLAPAGVALIQILPINEIAGGNSSPYGALSAFGIDPMYISLTAVADLQQLSNLEVLGEEGAGKLAALRKAAGVDYDAVRALKRRALVAGLKRFHRDELAAREPGPRGRDFQAFTQQHRAWLADYALYRAIKDECHGKPWWEWPAPLRDREAAALTAARARLGDEVLYFKYAQWLAHTQWAQARAALRQRGVEIMGDLPFMVDRDSADVWAERAEFRLDMSVGCPADQFDKDGQDWGLPPYDWAAMTRNDFAWLRRRARYSGELYDRFRIDHLVGFFRTGMRPYDARRDAKGKLVPARFDPADEPGQLAHGKRVIKAMIDGAAETGAQLIAEDLGSVPDYVRPALAELDVPGYKVLIWEKDGEKFRDPAAYPARSVACFGTHDTAPVAAWWRSLTEPERAAALELPVLRDLSPKPGKTFTPEVHAALLHLICGAASELVLLLLQDILGRSERINVPGTVGPHNWTYRLPTPIEQLARDPKLKGLLIRLYEAVGAGRRELPAPR